jgi:hypothetical protein
VRKCACAHIATCSLFSCHQPPSRLRSTSLVLLLPGKIPSSPGATSGYYLSPPRLPPVGVAMVVLRLAPPILPMLLPPKTKAATAATGGDAAVSTHTPPPPWRKVCGKRENRRADVSSFARPCGISCSGHGRDYTRCVHICWRRHGAFA